MMIDNRCPKCNQPVKGRQEITFGSDKGPKFPAKFCQYCNTLLSARFNEDGAMSSWYYTEAQTVREFNDGLVELMKGDGLVKRGKLTRKGRKLLGRRRAA